MFSGMTALLTPFRAPEPLPMPTSNEFVFKKGFLNNKSSEFHCFLRKLVRRLSKQRPCISITQKIFGVLLRQPPQLFFNGIAGFETSSRPYLLTHRAPLPARCHRSTAVCIQRNTSRYFLHSTVPRALHSTVPRAEQPRNVR